MIVEMKRVVNKKSFSLMFITFSESDPDSLISYAPGNAKALPSKIASFD
jgi:hypothetical protein